MTSIITIPRGEPVVRSLFGPVDHEQLRRDLKQRLREMSEQDARRWNFDFRSETPLPGRFLWEEIPTERTANFYCDPRESRARVPVTPRKQAAVEEEEEEEEEDGGDEGEERTDQENCPRMCNTKHLLEVTPVRRKRARSKSASSRTRNNTRITDFFPKRRRSTESKILQTLLSVESSQCKTIR